jgi:hypothetical protein
MNSSFSAPAHSSLLNPPVRAMEITLPSVDATVSYLETLEPVFCLRASLMTENGSEILFWRNNWFTNRIAG